MEDYKVLEIFRACWCFDSPGGRGSAAELVYWSCTTAGWLCLLWVVGIGWYQC